jgi:hypothetical protein
VSDFLTPDFRIWPQKGKFATEPHNPPLATTLLLIGAVSPGLRLTHHDASGHVPAG